MYYIHEILKIYKKAVGKNYGWPLIATGVFFCHFCIMFVM